MTLYPGSAYPGLPAGNICDNLGSGSSDATLEPNYEGLDFRANDGHFCEHPCSYRAKGADFENISN